ncbi:hypothetical protein Tco_0887856 [Tanacetum coccineum]
MRTRSSLKFVGEPSMNPTFTNPKRRNRRRSEQRVEPFALEETPLITSTLKYKDVPESSIKLMVFPFSIDGPARIWLDKEPPRSILTWDDLCPATDGNTFLGYRDNIQEYVSPAAVNYYQGNTGYRPQSVANQIRPPGGVSYNGPPIPPPFSSSPKVVERVPAVTKDTVQPSTENIQPSVVQTHVQIDEPVIAPKPKLIIPYPS